MNAFSISEKYKIKTIERYGDMTLLLYGSTVFGIENSDLDICFFSDTELSKERFENLKELTRNFHIANNLRIDEEVPYDKKLVYSQKTINDALEHPPFPYINGKFIINPIQKTTEFLGSDEMAKRLLINILTVRNKILYGDSEMVKKYGNQAWEMILRVVLSYAEKSNVTMNELLDYLYTDPFTNASGELYLGYKSNLQEKKDYIEQKVIEKVSELEEKEVVSKTLTKRYKFNERWIKNG